MTKAGPGKAMRGPARPGWAWRGAARAMAAILLAVIATPVEAHCYSVWHYPWAQQCGVARNFGQKRVSVRHEAPFVAHVALHKLIVAPPRNDFAPDRNDFEIPLPSLARADLDGGAADEPTRGRILLRAALEAAR
jgi:hypothetical protein